MADKDEAGQNPVIIKKYANRRLYNTQSSSYITLDDLARMTRNGVDFQVLDAKSGTDITHGILTQIIMEEEASGEQMLPISFLRQLISMYGNSMQSLIPHYLEASMDNFRANQKKMQDSIRASMGTETVAKLTETNMAMFNAAAQAFIPGQNRVAEPKSDTSEPQMQYEIDALRAQMAEMQKKLDKLGK
ncbi:polyhydroxyalkanoate synthesis repressor PhaR [Altericroceibacterium xinjiangense]|uniref:polyhydroxyalkanoate synthesis repressor PhaR n=1 Tax=Altericroceibacterium xinjiangense TaxID=762261 RepID=UPI000F7EBD7A|nr:polyhydroxyalkanoate synthesis repressor PhaR [Altericroceibacterium xinjiangense]